MHTCSRWRSVFRPSSWGGKQTSRGERDVIQADVTLWVSANLALKYDLKVPDVAQWDLSHLPVVSLISRQVQKEVTMPLTLPEHAERADSISGHVKVESHLETVSKRNMSTKVRIKQVGCVAEIERKGLPIYLSFPFRLIGALLLQGELTAVRQEKHDSQGKLHNQSTEESGWRVREHTHM